MTPVRANLRFWRSFTFMIEKPRANGTRLALIVFCAGAFLAGCLQESCEPGCDEDPVDTPLYGTWGGEALVHNYDTSFTGVLLDDGILTFNTDKTFLLRDSGSLVRKGAFVKRVLGAEIAGTFSLRGNLLVYQGATCRGYDAASDSVVTRDCAGISECVGNDTLFAEARNFEYIRTGFDPSTGGSYNYTITAFQLKLSTYLQKDVVCLKNPYKPSTPEVLP